MESKAKGTSSNIKKLACKEMAMSKTMYQEAVVVTVDKEELLTTLMKAALIL